MIIVTVKPNINLKVLAAVQGMNNPQLAQKVGVDKSYISLLFRGKRRYTPKVAYRIANALEEKAVNLFDFKEVN